MSRPITVGGTTLMSCFVCDQAIVGGEKKLVANTVTSYSKEKFAQKLCNLIGKDHVVLVTNKDYICGKCYALMNKIDKLEMDLDNARLNVMNIIEGAYRIAENANTNEASHLTTDSELGNRKRTTKNTANPNKMARIDDTGRIKVYKCGFCSYQSKDLNHVRMHMKVHLNAEVAQQHPPKQDPVKRRVFRCQVCSVSFDSKEKCLEHIGANHAVTGKKMLEQMDPNANKSLREHLQSVGDDKKERVGFENVEEQSTLDMTEEQNAMEVSQSIQLEGNKVGDTEGTDQVAATGEESETIAGEMCGELVEDGGQIETSQAMECGDISTDVCTVTNTKQESKEMDIEAILGELGKSE